ncbi:MAG: nucleotidyltransferase family protein [Candidatus Omnitrophica bacterium]|nr:nucleotidyltransferase family protein [Candidatus Omnitrophota bacterium]
MQSEDLLVCYLARVNIDKDAVRKVKKILSPELNWAYFFDLVKSEGVTPLAYKSLSGIDQAKAIVPKDIWKKMENCYYSVAASNTLLYQKLTGILTSFNETGVKVIVLKGAALAASIYGNAALRAMTDIDLLVKKEELPFVDTGLKCLGYSSADRSVEDIDISSVSYLTTLDYRNPAKNSPPLHIHYHFVNSTIPTHSYIDKIKIEKIWQEAEETEIGGVKTLVMSPHHLLIHLAEHSLRVLHSLNKLSYLCDINETVNFYGERLDWSKLVSHSFEFNLNRLVYFSLYFTAKFLNTAIPQKVLSALKPSRLSWEEKIFVKLAAENKRFPGLSYLLHLAMNEGLWAKARFILRTFFPPRHILAQRYYIPESKLNCFHYLYRMGEILSRGCKGICFLIGWFFEKLILRQASLLARFFKRKFKGSKA